MDIPEKLELLFIQKCTNIKVSKNELKFKLQEMFNARA